MAAFAGGVLTSASPCVIAAVPVAIGFVGGRSVTPLRALQLSLVLVTGLTLALTTLGLAAARFGLLMGTLPGAWTVATGLLIVVAGVWIGWVQAGGSVRLPAWLQQRLIGSGWLGALVLGALLGTVMTPCASPALAAALTWAGSGGAFGKSMWFGAALLAAYGLGHSLLVFAAGASPSAAQRLISRVGDGARWLPGRRSFALLMIGAGVWLALQPWLL
ncbi:MAG TPA: cytochrome c biogenesis protein CcdA [Burkholderiaceae bacterium]|nr:cytochrome c biogenesis protein CcdA [Burkholderiaceae bacterium]HQR70054.1 cytochrome c biogenesis protein CcdA [Burkholderiaceae bacterium]